MSTGAITRRQIIEDDAMKWGPEYAKQLDAAIAKNDEFVKSILAMNDANQKLRGSSNAKDLAVSLKVYNDEAARGTHIWKEQEALEKQLIATRNRNALATEATARAVARERIELANTNKEVKLQERARMGLVGAYEKLNTRRNEAQRTLANLLASEKASNAEVRRAQKEFEQLDRKVKAVDATTKNYSKEIGNYRSALMGMGGVLRSLITSFGIVGGISLFTSTIKDIYQTSKELQALDTALKQVTNSQTVFAEQQLYLADISNRYGLELQSVTRTYTQFYAAASDKLAASEIQDIFESVSKSASLMGLTVEQQEGAFLALQQMMSKGKVSAEELRGQLGERLPGAFGVMAKAIGVTESELDKMLQKGEIMAADVLPKFARELEKAYNAENVTYIKSMAAEQNRLSNEWTRFVRNVSGEGSVLEGVFSNFLFLLRSAADQVNSLLESSEDKSKKVYDTIRAQHKDVILKNYDDVAKLDAEELRRKAMIVAEQARGIREQQKLYQEAAKDIEKNAIRSPFGQLTREDEKRLNDNKAAIAKMNAELSALYGQIAGYNDLIKRAEKPISDTSGPSKAETEKRRKEYLQMMKQIENDEFALAAFRIKLAEETAQEVLKAESSTVSERVDALHEIAQLDETLSRETLANKLKNISRYDDSIRDLTDEEIKTLADGGEIKKELLASERLALEQHQAELMRIERRTNEQIEKITAFDPSKFESELKQRLTIKDTALQRELEAENKMHRRALLEAGDNNKAIEQAQEAHERRLFEIKKRYAQDALNEQINAVQKILDTEKLSVEQRIGYENQLATYRKQVSDLSLEQYEENVDKRGEAERAFADSVIEISEQIKGMLSNVVNEIFAQRIAAIDEEINREQQKYDRLIELASNDAAQQQLLRVESEKRREELEKKKRKEQKKQLAFDKAIKVTETIQATALAIMQAYAQLGPIGGTIAAVLIGTLGALQIGTIMSAKVPEYRTGRKGGPAEVAYVGDGGRSEVITRADGSDPMLTPARATLVKLRQGDIVHQSVDDYHDYVRRNLLSKIRERRNEVMQFASFDNSELVDEMRKTRKAIERQRLTVNTQSMPDLNHQLWAMSNRSW